jgi:hypothetical protein
MAVAASAAKRLTRGPYTVYTDPGGVCSAELTVRQVEVLRLINELTTEASYPSGLRIAKAMRPPISYQGLFCKLKALKDKNLVTATQGKRCTIRLTVEGIAVLAGIEAAA